MALTKSRMQMKYEKEVRENLMKERGTANINLVPRVQKIVLNVGVGEGKDNPKTLQAAVKTLTTITGQQALVTTARKSISNFKIRDGMKIGCMVTLRGHLMWHFWTSSLAWCCRVCVTSRVSACATSTAVATTTSA